MQSICRGHYEHLEYITQEGQIIKNLNKGEFYKYLGIKSIKSYSTLNYKRKFRKAILFKN
jgi:hypothetical protein